MNKLVFSDIEKEAIDFTQEELNSEGFNMNVWHVKEIPLPDEVITFCNSLDNVEFTTLINDDGKTIKFGYYVGSNGSYGIQETDKITTAIEMNEER